MIRTNIVCDICREQRQYGLAQSWYSIYKQANAQTIHRGVTETQPKGSTLMHVCCPACLYKAVAQFTREGQGESQGQSQGIKSD